MDFSSRSIADVVVARPVGPIDHPSAQALERALKPFLDEPPAGISALVLDFERVDYISSMGLRVLMVAAKRLRAQQRRIAVAGLNPVVQEIFDIARFNHVTETFPSLREALGKISPAALAAFEAGSQ